MKCLPIMIISFIFLVSCSSVEKAIKTTPAEKENIDYTFEVDQGYQDVYQRVLDQAKVCVKPQFTAKMVVNGELLNNIKAADITVDMKGFFSSNSYLKIRIDSTSDKKSRIHVSNKFPSWNGLARAVKTWVVENSTSCEVAKLDNAKT